EPARRPQMPVLRRAAKGRLRALLQPLRQAAHRLIAECGFQIADLKRSESRSAQSLEVFDVTAAAVVLARGPPHAVDALAHTVLLFAHQVGLTPYVPEFNAKDRE